MSSFVASIVGFIQSIFSIFSLAYTPAALPPAMEMEPTAIVRQVIAPKGLTQQEPIATQQYASADSRCGSLGVGGDAGGTDLSTPMTCTFNVRAGTAVPVTFAVKKGTESTYVQTISLAFPQTGQVLSTQATTNRSAEPPIGQGPVRSFVQFSLTDDYNFDGYADLVTTDMIGANFLENSLYMYEPGSGRFAKAGSGVNLAKPTTDKILITGKGGLSYYFYNRYRFENGTYVLVDARSGTVAQNSRIDDPSRCWDMKVSVPIKRLTLVDTLTDDQMTLRSETKCVPDGQALLDAIFGQ